MYLKRSHILFDHASQRELRLVIIRRAVFGLDSWRFAAMLGKINPPTQKRGESDMLISTKEALPPYTSS
jgi:hypothetical protein